MATNKYIIGPNMIYIFVRLKPISITFILSLVCPISMESSEFGLYENHGCGQKFWSYDILIGCHSNRFMYFKTYYPHF